MDTYSKPFRKEENNMQTPEEVKEMLLPVNVEYIKQHGVDWECLSDEFYWENGFNHYDRKFDRPMAEGGKPFTGLRYEFWDSDHLACYTQMKDGYPLGDDVGFYRSGALQSYTRIDDTEHYRYEWHENGVLKAVTQWNRKDNQQYYRSREYDETGKLLRQRIKFEIEAIYQPDDLNPRFDFLFHENGEFRQITNKAPSACDLYSEIELDPDGIPVRFVVNPHYIKYSLSECLHYYFSNYKTFDEKEFRYKNGVLQCRCGEHGTTWRRASGDILFHDGAHGDKFLVYDDGIPRGPQHIYDPSGQIREYYCISKGKEYCHHIYWYPNGMIREAIVYSHYDVMLRVTFDDKGKQRTCQLNAAVFKKGYKK